MTNSRKRKNSQVDFSDVFRTYFATQTRGVNYQVRAYANFRHDLQFLSSLIHDAIVLPQQCRRRGRRLQLALNRDRWELLSVVGELQVIPSRLVIEPVQKCIFSLRDVLPGETCSPELMISSLEAGKVADDENDIWTFALQGEQWEYRVMLPRWDFRIVLKDLPES
jgi:hypothetical protein